jgi:Asp-tRNA(Asn)/Glu-tRNA(Gln) amidotransferase A subunit family amidase
MVRYASDIKPLLKVFLDKNVSKLKLDENVDLSKLKVYYMYEIKEPTLTPVSSEIKKGIQKAVNYLKSEGATVKEVYLDKFVHSFEIWISAMKVDGAKKLSEELTNRKGKINPWVELIKSIYGGSKHTLAAIFGSLVDEYPPSEENIQKFKKLGNELKKELHELLGTVQKFY